MPRAARPPPWWTWIVPLPLFHLGSWSSLWFQVVPGVSTWYLPIPLGIALVYWWGPRVLPALYLNAVVCAPLWGFSWPMAPFVALPETLAVGLSWLLFIHLLDGYPQLTSQRAAIAFLLAGLLAPLVAAEALTQALLGASGRGGPLPPWEAALMGWLANTMGCFAVTVPLLVLAGPWMRARGWTRDPRGKPREPLLRPKARGPGVVAVAVALPALIALAAVAAPTQVVFLVQGLIVLGAALYFGFAMGVLLAGWMAFATTVLNPLFAADHGRVWISESEALEAALNLLMIAVAGFMSGRVISGSRNEIARRQRAERELEHAQATLLAAIEQSPAGIIIADAPDGRIRLVNHAALEVRGAATEPLIDIPIERHAASWRVFRPDGTPWPAEDLPLSRAIREGRSERGVDLVIRHADGGDRWVIANASPVRRLDGSVVGAIAVFTDVTERRRAEEEVRRGEKRYRTLIDATSEGFWMLDESWRTVDVNLAVCRMLKADRETVMARSPIDFADEAGRAVFAWQREQRKRVDNRSYEVTLVATDGERIDVRVNATTLRDGRGAFAGSFAFYTDITERKRAERALRDSEARFRELAELLPGIVFETDGQGRLQFVNRHGAGMLGAPDRETILGRVAFDFMSPPERVVARQRLDSYLAGATPEPRVYTYHRLDGGTFMGLTQATLVVRDGARTGIRGFVIDVTERQRAEETLRHAQKMEAVGQIAGGIAHDFNNLLGAIMGFAAFIVEDAGPDSSAHAFGQRIQKACERAKYMIQRLLAFSRRTDSERQPIRLADVLEESADLLTGSVPSSIRLDIHIDAPEAVVVADAVQLTQVFMNLCVNARDALEDQPGEIHLRVHILAADAWDQGLAAWDGARALAGEVRAGRAYVAIDVADTGRGMTQAIVDRVFEPFFTTKAAQRGTGLGLSVVHGIVLGHDGALAVRSAPGRGSCFRILLPLSAETPREVADAAPAAPATGTGRVLVVDDDVDFADVVSITLERAGMEVAVCNDPRQALEVFAEDPAAWDVLMTDHAMPEMTGLELVGHVHALRADIPCVLCTAYAGDRLTTESARAAGIAILLEKPVDPEDIAGAVRACLPSGGR